MAWYRKGDVDNSKQPIPIILDGYGTNHVPVVDLSEYEEEEKEWTMVKAV